MIAMLEWPQLSRVTETICSAAFHTILGGLVQLRSILLTVFLWDIGKLRCTKGSIFSTDSTRQGVAGACCI